MYYGRRQIRCMDVSTATPKEILRHCNRVFPYVDCYGSQDAIRFINRNGGECVIEIYELPRHFPRAFKIGAIL